MNETPNLCNCGCGKVVKHPHHRYAKGHAGKQNVQSRNDLLDATCAFCQQSIKVDRWRIERFGADNVYCSVGHAAAMRSKMATKDLVCEQCGKRFNMQASRKQGKHIFCGLDCSAQFKLGKRHSAINVTCDHCGKSFAVYASKLKKNKHFYCSIDCRAQHIRGKNNPAYRSGTGRHPYYGGNWRKQRRAAVQRDNATCQHCGKIPKRTRYLEVHHIRPAYLFNGDFEASNQLFNLICLCVTCHKKAEKGAIVIQPKLL